MMRTANRKTYEDIHIGDTFSFTKTFTKEDVLSFAALTGDQNPLHVDVVYGKESTFGKNVVHGMLVAGLCSTLCGMYCPGERSLLLNQKISYKEPVYQGEEIVVTGEVVQKVDSVRIITLACKMQKKDGPVVIEGEVMAQVL